MLSNMNSDKKTINKKSNSEEDVIQNDHNAIR